MTMKVTLNGDKPERKPVAVIGQCGLGVFFPTRENRLIYVTVDGIATFSTEASLEKALKSLGRTAVYEGDTITLSFKGEKK